MTAYEDILNQFIKRTMFNLELVQAHARQGDDAYEVTQLINSLLGLVVLPQQTLFNKIPKTPFIHLKDDGWPGTFLVSSSMKGKQNNDKYDDNLNNLLRYLRNGIAHFNIKAFNVNDHISGIIINDKLPGFSEPHWTVTLSLKDLEIIIDKLAKLSHKLHRSSCK